MEESLSSWPFSVGQRTTRREVHARVGGAHQWGITSCLQGKAVLVFSNPAKGRKFGYDRWQGWRPDGRFHYTGQGITGNQDIASRSNKVLLRTIETGLPIYLFEVDGKEVVYQGEFALDQVPYRIEDAPDARSLQRKVVVFHLVPGASSSRRTS